MKNFFKPEDFGFKHTAWPSLMADIANEKLNALIESCPLYYCKEALGSYHTFTFEKFRESTHTFRLAFIEPIVAEPCKHEPDLTYLLPPTFTCVEVCKCRHCGVELQATWSAK